MATKTSTPKAAAVAAPKFDIYEHINQVVIEGLEKEGLQWFKSWKDNEGPINRATKTRYNGINVFWLNWICRSRDYAHNQWLSFKQITDLGGKLIKGSKSTEIFYYTQTFFHKGLNKWFSTEQQLVAAGSSVASPEVTKHMVLRYFNVFNIAQTTGIEPLGFDTTEVIPNEAAETIVDGYCAAQNLRITHDDASAYYSPKMDYVNMPEQDTFVCSDSYYKVLFHELAHSTGHSTRLNREGITNISFFGTDTYAKEELIAEISAMYMVGQLGLNPKDDLNNSQAYIKGWVSKLKEHKYECVSAMTQAAKAVEYINKFNS